MSPLAGWSLAALAVLAGWFSYGWGGLALAVSVIVFWLLLLFNRSLRAMGRAAQRPPGTVDSAVMLNAKLHEGMTMLQVIGLTRSLGRKVDDPPDAADGADEHWRWQDNGGASVTVGLRRGKVVGWTMQRPPAADADGGAPAQS